MVAVTSFIISGLVILILIVAKKWENKRRKQLFIMNIISKGDIHIREAYHKGVHLYSEGKEQAHFFFNRKVPIHSRNSLNKLTSFLKERREQYIHNMRNSRLLKKSDGISEFFKSMSEIEKGNGEINDVYEDTSLNDRSVGRGSQDREKELE